jgi:uncharacterized protein
MRYGLIVAALFAVLLSSIDALAQKHVKHQIVMQLSTGDTLEWKGTINNLRNLKKGWGNDVEIEVVAHGPGIGFLMKNKTTQLGAIKMLKSQGVIFVACENTLREKKIEKSEIIPEAGFVPMGIAEIVLKQEAGWKYIKAGF